MSNINTRLVVDGDSAKATQAVNTTEQAVDAVRRKTQQTANESQKDVAAIRHAWSGLTKQVTLTDEAFLRGNFSGEMIGGALRSVTADVGRLMAVLGGLNKNAEFTASAMTNVAISIASGNPFMGLASAAQAATRNITDVAAALKDVDKQAKQIRGMQQQKWWNTLHESVREAYGMDANTKSQFIEAPTTTFELHDKREEYEAKQRAIREKAAAEEAKITADLIVLLDHQRMSATDFAIKQAQRELDAFEGTEAQRAIAVQIAEEKVKKIRAGERAAADLRDQQRMAETLKLQQQLEKATLSTAEYAIKQLQRELAAFVGTAEQRELHAKVIAAKIYQINEALRQQNLARAKATAEKELQIKQEAFTKEVEARRLAAQKAQQFAASAAKREAEERQKVLMHPAALAWQERQERRQFRRDERADRRLNRIVRTAEAARDGGRQLSRRQRAALEFVQARDERKQAEKLQEDQAKNIAKIEVHMASLVKTTAALYGTAAAENRQ